MEIIQTYYQQNKEIIMYLSSLKFMSVDPDGAAKLFLILIKKGKTTKNKRFTQKETML